MTGEQLREILKEKGYSLSKIAELLDITPQTLNSRLRAKSIKEEYIQEIEKVTGSIITHNAGNINLGTVGGHNVNISDPAAKKIIESDRISIERELSIEGYLQTIKGLEARIKDLERVIEAKDALISVLQNKS